MTDYKARWLRVEELNKLLVEESTRRLGLLDGLIDALPGVIFDHLVDNETELMDAIRAELADAT